MAVDDGRTEVRDSEDEPMTSSPIGVAGSDADKLSATGPVPLQDRQDALPEANGSHQARAQGLADTAPDSAEALGVDRCNASFNVDELLADPSEPHGIVPSRRQGHTNEASDGIALSETVFAFLPPDTSAKNMTLPPHTPEENQTPHNPGLTSQMLCAAAAGRGDSNDHSNLASKAELVTYDVADVVDCSPTSNPKEQVGDAKVLTSRTNSGPVGEQTPLAIYEERDPGSIGAPSIVKVLLKRGDEVDHTNNDFHREPAMKPSPQDLEKKRYASSDAVDDIMNDYNAVPNETNLSMSNATKSASESMDSKGTSGIESMPTMSATFRLQRGTPGETNETQAILDASETLTQSYGADTCLENCNRYREGQNLSATILEPLISQTTTESTSNWGSSKEQPRAKDAVGGSYVLHGKVTTSSVHKSKEATLPAPAVLTSQLKHASLQPAGPSIICPPPPKSPQEVTLAALKTEKTALLASLAALPAIQVLIEESESSEVEANDANDGPTEADIMAAANKIVKEHIKLLHEYNELKDMGQGLMGLIADQRGVRIVEVQDEFGIEGKD
ncbi:Swi5-domain-containing protein [Plenodomus tracheiphilus IPT5]|uniref:Swi5-domain-containing protein n=1 Tax=Plenodomus tracheiphilus IPT5 TaxID=1408161 RepID=A0A6A7AYM7_9PLEO|nr:Swi5-domain-containing protein [Plenodomus tracheiphilus IPT5]